MGFIFKIIGPLITLFLFVSCALEQRYETDQISENTPSDKAINLPANYEIISELSLESDISTNHLKLINEDEALKKFVTTDLFFKAQDSSLHGNSELAKRLYLKLSKISPDYYFQKKYAVELIRMGELTEATAVLTKIYEETKHRDINVGLVLAGVYTALENTKMARTVYHQLLLVDKSNEDVCVFLAKSYALSHKIKNAKEVLEKCDSNANRKNGMFNYYIGKIFLEEDKIAEAKKYFEKSLKQDPSFYQAVVALGLIAEQEGKIETAIRIYKKYLNNYPDEYAVLDRIVQVLFNSGEYKEVLPYAESLASLDQDDLNLKVKIGIIYTDLDRLDDARDLFKEILVAVPNSDKVLYYLGALSQQTNQIDEAVDYFGRITEDSPLFHDSSVQIGQLLMSYASEKKEYEQKLVALVKERSPKNELLMADLNLMLASYYEDSKEYSKAIDLVVPLVSLKEVKIEHSYFLASLYEKNGNLVAARKIISEIIQKDPTNADALNFLGYSLLEEGINLDYAYELIKKALSLKPNDPYIRDSLGWYYYKIGDLDRALVELKKAWESSKADSVITKHLAHIYGALNKTDLAEKHFDEALKRCRDKIECTTLETYREDFRQGRLPASQ